MSTARIDVLNIGLMLVALAAALTLPFELFLFSYAVLGPLHYLTEISWLRQRGYFTERRPDWLVLVGLTLVFCLGSTHVLGDRVVTALQPYQGDAILLAFGLALVFVVTGRTGLRWAGGLAVLALVALLHDRPYQAVIFALYVPTIVHVFVFTGAFVLYGALKHKSTTGYVSFLVFVLCAEACFLLRFDVTGYRVGEYVRQAYLPFLGLNLALTDHLGFTRPPWERFFSDERSVAVMRFIAWAYTYHYLNWFSKTSIIGWHRVPKRGIALVVAIWIVSLVLYGIDYSLGFKWLFLLSLAHVLLEFPLNHRSFLGIGSELAARARWRGRRAAAE